MAEKSVYHSSTMGEIPLSFTGRHLLQSLREEIQELLGKRYDQGLKDGKGAARQHTTAEREWEPLSRVRGKLAKYMSDLEGKVGTLGAENEQLKRLSNALDRQVSSMRKNAVSSVVSNNVNALLDSGFTVSVAHDYRSPPDKSYTVRVDGVVNADQAQRIGQHIIDKKDRDIERHNQKININAFRGPLEGLVGKAMIVEIKAPDEIALSDYVAIPRPPLQYIREIKFAARGAKAARTVAKRLFAQNGFTLCDQEFDVYVKTRD